MKQKETSAAFSKYQVIAIVILALTQFSVVLDFMVMSPLGDLIMKNMKIAPSEFGIVVSCYAFSAGISGFFTATIADKYDRKKLLLVFYSGFIVGTLLCGLATNYWFLVSARIVTGIFGGVIGSISLAIVADIFELNQRGRVMGFLQMGFGISQILGIPISLFLATKWNWQAPFYMIVGLALVIFTLSFFALKPIVGHLSLQRDNPIKHMWKTISNRNYRIGFLATAFMSLGGYLMMPWGSSFSVNNVGIAQSDLPLMFMIIGLSTISIMPIIGKLSDRFNKYSIFVASSIVMIISVVVYTNLGHVSFTVLVVVNMVMMAGIMARMIPSQALTTSVPEPKDRGAFMSINSSLQQMAGGIAALVGGAIVQQKNEFSPLEYFDTLGYVVIVVISLNIFFTYRVYNFVKKRN
jgi:predicted MFS family arabinose efflux permease